MAIGRYGWATGDWTLTGAGDLDGLLAGLAPEVERRNLVARLKLAGRLSLAERVAVRDRLENGLAHEVRWLDLDVADLTSRPTESDLSDIDVNGVLREATERLQEMVAEGGVEGRRAAAALERLYIEHQRAQRGGA